MITAAYVIFWIALGFFFLCVSSTMVLLADLDGIPPEYLHRHLQTKVVQNLYKIPELSMMGGIVFLATGYALDVGERAGCPFFFVGCIFSFSFVGMVVVIMFTLKKARAKLTSTENAEGKKIKVALGKYFVANWKDILDKGTSPVKQNTQKQQPE